MEVVSSLALAAALRALPAPMRQPPVQPPYWSAHVFGGRSFRSFLGGFDIRTDLGAGIAYAKREPHFRYRNTRGYLVQELDYSSSHSKGYAEDPRNVVQQFAYQVLARYEWFWGHTKMYSDFGWGLEYSTRRLHDRPSQLNSVPVIGLGVLLRAGNNDFTLGLRLKHISNAHFLNTNPGQNEILFDFGIRF